MGFISKKREGGFPPVGGKEKREGEIRDKSIGQIYCFWRGQKRVLLYK